MKKELVEMMEEMEDGTTRIIINLGEEEKDDLSDLIAEKVYNKIKNDFLINNSKNYIGNSKKKKKEITDKEFKIGKVEYLLKEDEKHYLTTSDLLSDPDLCNFIDQSVEAIRLMRKTVKENDNISMFKKNPDNSRSPWIISYSKLEESLINKFKRKRRKKG